MLFWVALAIHVVVLSALIVVPLTQVGSDLPEFESMATFIVRAPAPPPPPPPPPPAPPASSSQASRPEPPRPVLRDASFVVPVDVSDAIPEGDFGPESFGVPGGVEGGIPGGVIGGIVGGLAPAQEVNEPAEPVRLDFKREEARPVVRVDPVYPDLAAQARVQGVVILEVRVNTPGRTVPSKRSPDGRASGGSGGGRRRAMEMESLLGSG